MFLKPGLFCIHDLNLLWLLIVLLGFCPIPDTMQHAGLHNKYTRMDDITETTGHHGAGS
jgi:hypothetical protein